MSWAVVPAAGSGRRFGGQTPKQYLTVYGRPMIEHTLRALLSHPEVNGVVVAIARDDHYWAGWREFFGKPVITCLGGAQRSDSVLAGLYALPASVTDDDWVLVHDAARPCISRSDITQLLVAAKLDPVGAILAAPMRDTVKRGASDNRILATEPRDALWRAFTPQCFRRGGLTRALESAVRWGISVTDEASAMERIGLRARLVMGSEENLKVTTPIDLLIAETILARLLQ